MGVALLMNYFVIFIGLQNTFAQLPAGELHTNDGSNSCVVKLDTCRLKVKDYPLLERGEKGEPGPRGLPGPIGPPGSPGIPGTCTCRLSRKETLFPIEGVEGFLKEDNDKTCNMAPRALKSGNYTTGIPSGYFDIYCNMTTRETCIRKNLKTPTYNYSAENGTLWLSRVGINLRDIYGLNFQQISWLQSLSSSARQTLKYHCFDSVPYPKFGTTPPVKLLTWNDIVIGPYPKTDSPFFYSVPPETDGCVEGSSTWNSTIIVIISTNANRLPIRDIWIGDVRGKNQKMYIENIEICFG